MGFNLLSAYGTKRMTQNKGAINFRVSVQAAPRAAEGAHTKHRNMKLGVPSHLTSIWSNLKAQRRFTPQK